MKDNPSCVVNPYRAFTVFITFILLAYFMTGCGGGSSNEESSPVTSLPVIPMPAAGELALITADKSGLEKDGIESYGDVYSGIYKAHDGVSIDVWVSVRETDTQTGIGTINRMGVAIQGGTGLDVTHLLTDDEGLHTVWVAINYRGSNLTNLTAEWECIPGRNFISCLKGHDTFSKINPKLNAQDANSVIRLFTDDDGEITVDGTVMKTSAFVPAGTTRSPVNLHTSSFGGVIVSYMLAEENRPELHNVFFEQVTVPNERPISDGLNNAARMMDILFSACEGDTSCSNAYPDIRVNFRDFMDAHHSTAIEIDGERIYAGGVLDRIVSIIDGSDVGKAIRYIGEIAKAHNDGSTAITTGYGPQDYVSLLGEQPQAEYGFPQLDSRDWVALLRRFPDGSFPGITNRTGMICSFGINRAADPDSLDHYNMVKTQELPRDSGGTKEAFGYGFLLGYKTFLSVCPQLVEQTGGLELPDASDIEAANVIVYRGGLDIKHYFNPDPSQDDEIMAYFTSSPGHRRVITHRFLGQQLGQDQECLETIFRNFWKASDTSNQSLGDDCEESNGFSASELRGW